MSVRFDCPDASVKINAPCRRNSCTSRTTPFVATRLPEMRIASASMRQVAPAGFVQLLTCDVERVCVTGNDPSLPGGVRTTLSSVMNDSAAEPQQK